MQKTSTVTAKQPRRLAPLLCLIGCGLGAMLVIAGAVWSIFGSGQAFYSPDQAKEWEEASAAWHAQTIGHAHQHSPGAGGDTDREAAVAAARARFEKADAALQRARFAKNRLGPLLEWIGLAGTIAFGVGYLACRSA